MKLKDGIYEVEDLFYENHRFTVAVAQNNIEFARDIGPEMRLRLEVLHPDLDFSKIEKIQRTVSEKRCEFMKSALKSALASATDSRRMADVVAGILDVFRGWSLFETSFFQAAMLGAGLNYIVQKNGAPFAESVTMHPGGPNWIGSVIARTILACPGYTDFREARRSKMSHGDPADVKLHSVLTKTPFNVKAYSWTKADAEESLEIVKANPFLRRYV